MAERRIGRWLLVAVFAPVIGGIIGYWRFRNDDARLAAVLLAGTFAVPVLLIGMIVPGRLLSVPPLFAVLAGGLAAVGVAALLNRVFAENPYHLLLWACYGFLPGVIYLYYGPYSDQPRLRRAVKRFAIESMVAAILLMLLAPLIPFIGVVLFGFV